MIKKLLLASALSLGLVSAAFAQAVVITGGGGASAALAITNPTSTLALPATTTAYAANTLMCSSATVATCNTTLAAQSFAIANAGGSAIIPRVRLAINDATSTGWGLQTVQIDFWGVAPTFATTGDRGVFATDFATGSQTHLGSYTCVFSAVLADGVESECSMAVGPYGMPKLASGTAIWWTATAISGSGVTGASKTVTLIPEVANAN